MDTSTSKIKARDLRSLALQGAHIEGIWNTQTPQVGIDSLWPSVLAMDKIQLESCEATSGAALADLLRSKGDTVESYPIPYYREQVYTGQPRLLDNSDWLKGKEPVYGTFGNLSEVRLKLIPLIKDMISFYEGKPDSYVAKCELEDLPKITAQQWKRPGWFLDSPITEAEVPAQLSPLALKMLDFVAATYAEKADPAMMTKPWRELALMDYDPDDSMTGSPTFAAGEKTHEARVSVLSAAPVPEGSAEEWYMKLLQLQDQLGLPDPFMYSPVLSTRLGPRKKPMKLWNATGALYEASQAATGAYCRVRYVYPAPYLINYIWSALYEQMSTTRQRIPGLWHDPLSQSDYEKKLRAQGSTPYAIDFSGMDTGMFPNIIMAIARALLKHGFAKWPLEVMLTMYPHMGISYPNIEGDSNSISMIKGPARPWCSGFKLTSEFDTIYGLTVLLTALSKQYPDIPDQWRSGKFVIAELGDDIIFTSDLDIDVDQLSRDAAEEWGATIKLENDVMFLKWMLPLVPEVPVKTRPFARLIQQTFFNEDKYSGTEGGDRPPAIMRMALKSRMIGLTNHPDFKMWWPKLEPILMMLPFVAEGGRLFIDEVLLGDKLLIPGDDVAILQFAKSNSTYISSLMDRAKYEPSAAALARLWEQLGIERDEVNHSQMRAIYDRALFTPPTNATLEALYQYTSRFTAV